MEWVVRAGGKLKPGRLYHTLDQKRSHHMCNEAQKVLVLAIVRLTKDSFDSSMTSSVALLVLPSDTMHPGTIICMVMPLKAQTWLSACM